MAGNGNIFNMSRDLFDHLKHYLNLRIRLLKMDLTERWVRLISDIILFLVMVAVIFFTLLFLSFAFAYWFGANSGNYPLGFLLTAGFWVLLGLLIYLFRRPLLLDPITKYTAREFLEKENPDKGDIEDDL